ncbi:MAG TPA: hypothetical protein VIA45_00590 [Thermoanaerobaculia bacterium]
MTAGRLIEITMGFVIPTAAVIWGVWLVWRAFRPGDIRQPSPVFDGIVGFLLICLFVVLVVLGWELFKTWRPGRPARPAATRAAAIEGPGVGIRRTARQPG